MLTMTTFSGVSNASVSATVQIDPDQQGQGVAVGEPNPSTPPNEPQTEDQDGTQTGQPTQPTQQGNTFLGQQNLAESNQVGGIGAGDIIQRSQGAVNEQYCKTIAGIGDRRCAQIASEGGDNLQRCSAIAGLGQATCLQSENPDGETGTCLTANGQPFICETSTGKAISGSGQAGVGSTR